MQKTYCFYFLLIIATTFKSLGQNPIRKVVFTLNDNEQIVSSEYHLVQQFNKTRFACMVHDNLNEKTTFIFNGKRIKTGNFLNYNDNEQCILHSFNVINDSSYILSFRQKDKWHINYNGIINGGFEAIEISNNNWGFKSSENNYDYFYKLADRWYAHHKGKNKKINYIHNEYKEGKYIVQFNGNQLGSYNTAEQLQITNSGKYGFVFSENYKGYFINNNGNISKPYENVEYFTILENEKWAYAFKENSKWHVNINGIISKPYDRIENFIYLSNGKYAYSFNENGMSHINNNGTIKAINKNLGNIIISEDGKLIYSYYENKNWHVNVEGADFGPYEHIYNLNFFPNGNWSFAFFKNGKSYINNKENISESFGSFLTDKSGNIVDWSTGHIENEAIEISSNNDNHSFYSSYKYEYVVVDGRSYGKSPAIQAWYDKKANSFFWTAVEGKELLCYEIKLD